MPTGTLPEAGYLGDIQRTTQEFQTGINEVLAYVLAVKAEIDALSNTELKEGSVRGVGTAASELVTNARINDIGPVQVYSVADPGPISVNYTQIPSADRKPGLFFVEVDAKTSGSGSFGKTWVTVPIVSFAQSSTGGLYDSSSFSVSAYYDAALQSFLPSGKTANGDEDYRITAIARNKV